MPHFLIALLLPLLILAGCQSSKVTVDYDSQTNFNSYRFYQWLPDKSGTSDDIDPLMSERIKDALEQQLPNTGMKPAQGEQAADVLVRYFMARSTKSSGSKGSVGVGGASGGGGSVMGLSMSMPLGGDSVTQQAQVMVDFIDAKDEKLKWRGSRTFKFSDEPPEQLTAMVQEVIAEILAKYPPGKKAK